MNILTADVKEVESVLAKYEAFKDSLRASDKPKNVQHQMAVNYLSKLTERELWIIASKISNKPYKEVLL